MIALYWKSEAARWRARALELEADLDESRFVYESALGRAEQRGRELSARLDAESERAREAEYAEYAASEQARRLEAEKRRGRW